MKRKEIPAQLFFCIGEEVTRKDIPAFAARAIPPLQEALAKTGLEAIGPLQLICPEWKGADAKNRLIIGLPVSEEKTVEQPWFFWTAPAFTCVAKEHRGSLAKLHETWNEFVEECGQEGVQPTGSWREVYLHMTAFDSPDNLVEMQVETR